MSVGSIAQEDMLKGGSMGGAGEQKANITRDVMAGDCIAIRGVIALWRRSAALFSGFFFWRNMCFVFVLRPAALDIHVKGQKGSVTSLSKLKHMSRNPESDKMFRKRPEQLRGV